MSNALRAMAMPDSGRSRGGTVAALIAAGLALPALCFFVLGMPILQALLIGAVAVVVAALVRFPPDGFDSGFPEPPAPIRDRGARREAFRLSWNVTGRNDRVGSTLVTRLQVIAEHRLAVRGLRLHDPADRDRVIGLVGAGAFQLLSRPPGSEARTRDFHQALAAVERLTDDEAD
ncbi:hypothetical protein GCM10011575_45750 [Microlunatus endophyticus]|uniref:Uncharacterized protein n=1 Tax=Microlunatus endophyticus TaxID=1716077 RepID=A0A917SIH4_9ACTN|nr:hypothetical protein [Microlunatus endophyticus]GGL82391.1 hypothetical protein GCM10011575_45750 [Microlunatus endophyticus]